MHNERAAATMRSRQVAAAGAADAAATGAADAADGDDDVAAEPGSTWAEALLVLVALLEQLQPAGQEQTEAVEEEVKAERAAATMRLRQDTGHSPEAGAALEATPSPTGEAGAATALAEGPAAASALDLELEVSAAALEAARVF